MRLRGRPLRFLLLVGLSWVVARLYFISPFAERPGGMPPVVLAEAPASAMVKPAEAVRVPSGAGSAIAPSEVRMLPPLIVRGERPHRRLGLGAPGPLRLALAPMPAAEPEQASPTGIAGGGFVKAISPAAGLERRDQAVRRRRLSGYAYLFAREGSAGAPLSTDLGQLGGSQAGLRLDYALSDRLALTGRVSAPLETARDREAALGIKWTPLGRAMPALYIERRQSLGPGGRNAFSLTATGGVGAVALPGGFRLDAYGQAGVVGLKRRDAFIEGQVSATREIATLGGASLALGAGAWGGAQAGVERLDLGPRARLGLRLGGGRGAGLAVDYRHRLAGNARPSSGIAVTLDTGF